MFIFGNLISLFFISSWRIVGIKRNIFWLFSKIGIVLHTDDLQKNIKECISVHQLKIVRNDLGRYSYASIEEQSQDLQSRAASRLTLQLYTNQMLAPLINVAIYAFLKSKLSTIGIHFTRCIKALNRLG